MKNEAHFRNLLGLTQQEMAILLGVTRGHWSMYESGFRILPLHAMQLLNELTFHLQDSEKKIHHAPAFTDKELAAQQQHLKLLMRENELRQTKLAKQLAPAQRKLADHPKRRQVADFLANHITKQGKAASKIHQGLADYLNLPEPIDPIAALNQELKLEMLAFEKKLLEAKMQELKQQLPPVKE